MLAVKDYFNKIYQTYFTEPVHILGGRLLHAVVVMGGVSRLRQEDECEAFDLIKADVVALQDAGNAGVPLLKAGNRQFKV